MRTEKETDDDDDSDDDDDDRENSSLPIIKGIACYAHIRIWLVHP